MWLWQRHGFVSIYNRLEVKKGRLRAKEVKKVKK